jgi:hypothetical protein
MYFSRLTHTCGYSHIAPTVIPDSYSANSNSRKNTNSVNSSGSGVTTTGKSAVMITREFRTSAARAS